MKKYILLSVILIFFSCVTTESGVPSVWTGDKGSYVETETKPNQIFTSTEIKSIAIMRFDAKSVKTLRGEIVDYIELGNDFTDDLIKKFYINGKVKVAVGEYPDYTTETDYIERKIGDVEIKSSSIERTLSYKSTPYRKIDAILIGRITKFNPEKNFDKSYIEIYFKLTNTYDGTVFWISRMRGFYIDVINTIADTIIKGKYTEPILETE